MQEALNALNGQSPELVNGSSSFRSAAFYIENIDHIDFLCRAAIRGLDFSLTKDYRHYILQK